MPVGTASDLMVGETVIAIGNAYGYEHTVSAGVVSAIKRDVGWEPQISLKQGIKEMVEWGRKYIDHLREVSTGYVLRA